MFQHGSPQFLYPPSKFWTCIWRSNLSNYRIWLCPQPKNPYVYTDTHIFTYMYIHTCIYIYIYIIIYIYKYLQTYMYIYIYLFIYIYIFIDIYIYIFKYNFQDAFCAKVPTYTTHLIYIKYMCSSKHFSIEAKPLHQRWMEEILHHLGWMKPY